MQIFELLDRFELLYKGNQDLADLRRAYIDKDLSSIFRLLLKTNDSELVEEYRKAVMENNLHSLFRLLPKDNIYDDLRRAVTERNLHSLFRIIDSFSRPADITFSYSSEDILEDFRKAITEKNLHSLFRLLSYEDLRKSMLEDNIWSVRKLIDEYQPNQIVKALKSFDVNEMEFNEDCLTRGQIESKTWLVEELAKLKLDLGTVFLCAGWYATLAVLMFESNIKLKKIRSFDLDESCESRAEIFNKPWYTDRWQFKALTADIMDIDYENGHTWSTWSKANNRMSNPVTDIPDTIINTSCEHISDFKSWYKLIPVGKYVILQTNNYFEIDEHVNCSRSLAHFQKSCPMSEVYYSGEKQLEKYKRFMIIGKK